MPLPQVMANGLIGTLLGAKWEAAERSQVKQECYCLLRSGHLAQAWCAKSCACVCMCHRQSSQGVLWHHQVLQRLPQGPCVQQLGLPVSACRWCAHTPLFLTLHLWIHTRPLSDKIGSNHSDKTMPGDAMTVNLWCNLRCLQLVEHCVSTCRPCVPELHQHTIKNSFKETLTRAGHTCSRRGGQLHQGGDQDGQVCQPGTCGHAGQGAAAHQRAAPGAASARQRPRGCAQASRGAAAGPGSACGQRRRPPAARALQ